MKFARNRVGPTTKDGTSRSRCFEKYPRRAPRTSRVGVWGLAHGAPGAQETVRAQWMEDAVEELAHRALSHAQGKRSVSHHRYIIGIAGVPGGGKSTLASAVCSCINKLAASEVAANVPMDGFHYYRRELDSMPDPVQANKKRGAPWTFNVEAYVDCLKQAKFLVTSMTAPSFDHGIGDPKENAIEIHSHHNIIVTEGNYVLLDTHPWASLVDVLDDSWYVDCDLDVAMKRVFARQTSHGVHPEVSRCRISTNDRPNGQLVMTTKCRARVVVPSLPYKETTKRHSD